MLQFTAPRVLTTSHNTSENLTTFVTTFHNIPKRPSNNMQNRTIPHNTVKPPPQHLTTSCNITKILSQQLTIPNNISPQLTTFRNVSHNNSQKKTTHNALKQSHNVSHNNSSHLPSTHNALKYSQRLSQRLSQQLTTSHYTPQHLTTFFTISQHI